MGGSAVIATVPFVLAAAGLLALLVRCPESRRAYTRREPVDPTVLASTMLRSARNSGGPVELRGVRVEVTPSGWRVSTYGGFPVLHASEASAARDLARRLA